MKLRDLMTPNPVVLKPDQSAREAAVIFVEHLVDGAPVVSADNSLVGLFTKNHLCNMVSAGMDLNLPVKEVMTSDVATGHPDDELGNYLPDLERLCVVEGDEIVGIITRTNLLRVFFDSYHSVASELETIINSVYNLIISVDGEGNVRVFNRSAEKLLGLKDEEIRGKNIVEVFPTSNLAEVARTGKVEPLQKIKLNNRYFISNRSPIIKAGKVIGAVAVLQDISDMERISSELKYVKELNEELGAIIESSFDGLLITDGRGVCLRVNQALERITGIHAHEFLGRNVYDLAREGVVSESVSAQVLKRKEPVTIIEETKTGRFTLATGTPVFDRKGHIFRVVCNIRDITELNMLRQKLEHMQGLSQHYESQIRTLRLQYAGSNKLIVNSGRMRELLDLVFRLAQVDSTILITGESGTGKELIAETIHNNSPRKNNPFIKVNCGAIPENLLESELFGYESGAFTGARKEGKQGYFELARGGTLFLDEIGDLPLNLQVKLLRVLQSKEIIRVGGGKPLEIDVRILAGTNRNLKEMVGNKEFREDLYYRLNVVPVNVPPLRERKEEIPALVAHFIQAFNSKYNLTKRIAPTVVDVFMEYDWPGNVRELENLIERLVVVSTTDNLEIRDLPSFLGNTAGIHSEVLVTRVVPLKEAVASVEKQILEKAYAQFRSAREIARALKVDASTIVRKAAKYGLSNPNKE